MLERLEKLIAEKRKLDMEPSALSEAVYAAFHSYVQAGYSLADLPWFSLYPAKDKEKARQRQSVA